MNGFSNCSLIVSSLKENELNNKSFSRARKFLHKEDGCLEFAVSPTPNLSI